MNSGIYAACAGLIARTDSVDTIANNLANASTAGFRAREGSFSSILAESGRRPLGSVLNQVTNRFGVLGATRLDATEGSITNTGNQLDAAIEGSGYFAVQTAGGVQYTRNGSFRLSPTGQLVTQSGDAVLGQGGTVTLPPGPVSIASDGTLSANGAVVGKLRIVDFAPNAQPESAGAGNYTVPEASVQPAAGSAVRQGALENSNVNPVASVVALIDAQRSAEQMRHALTLFDSDLNKTAAQDIPRVNL